MRLILDGSPVTTYAGTSPKVADGIFVPQECIVEITDEEWDEIAYLWEHYWVNRWGGVIKPFSQYLKELLEFKRK